MLVTNDPLSKVQKRIIRLICNVHYTFNTRHLITALKIMPLSSIYKFRLSLFMYKTHYGLQPRCIAKPYCENNIIHNYGTRQRKHLHTPIGNTSHIYRSFYFQSIQFWSNIEIDGNFFLFKNKLR